MQVQEITRKVQNLPPLPQVVARVIALSGDSEAGIDEYVMTIGSDNALTANVLKLSNSGLYGASRSISSIKEAIVRLGLRTVINLVLAISSARYFKLDTAGYRMSTTDLWIHSVTTAIIAKTIAGRIPQVDGDTCFTGGLLHDIGKSVLSSFAAERYENIRREVEKGEASLLDAERGVLGFGHTDVGAMILHGWKLPEVLVRTAGFHHEPELVAEGNLTVHVVHVANAISALCSGTESSGMPGRISPKSVDILGFDMRAIDEIVASAGRELELARDLFDAGPQD